MANTEVPTATLRPMTQAEYDAWLPGAQESYAADHVRAGSMPAESAREMAEKQFNGLLPDGLATVGHHLLIPEIDGADVGLFWLHIPTDTTAPAAFIYDIHVDERSRGRGYGRAIMRAGEDYARQHGAATMRLHVFGDNTVARHLYESLDYGVTNVMMAKTLT